MLARLLGRGKKPVEATPVHIHEWKHIYTHDYGFYEHRCDCGEVKGKKIEPELRTALLRRPCPCKLCTWARFRKLPLADKVRLPWFTPIWEVPGA